MSAAFRPADFVHIAPILVVALWACLVLLADALGKGKSARLWPLSVLGLLLGLGATAVTWLGHRQASIDLFGGMIVVDRYALFFDATFLLAALLTSLLAGPTLERRGIACGEHHSLLLFVTTGMMILVHASSFVTLVIGLETMSLGIYALVASVPGSKRSAEAGFKYFVMGSIASAFLLYGIALLYGATGQMSFAGLASRSSEMAGNPLFLLGMLLVLGAMGFKVALVPFHAWTPDAYEGAPTTVTGFMAAAVKAAGFAVLLRVLTTVFAADSFVFGKIGWGSLLYLLAIATMVVGNLAALRQSNLKRMLAYSSIAHAGYLTVGVLAVGAVTGADRAPILYYLLSYAVTTLGAFGMIAWIGDAKNERTSVEDWVGLARRHPAAAAGMTLFLLSLAGIPPTAGFFAKFYIFRAALVHPGLLPLVILAALMSVVSIAYYLRPVVAMYFRESDEEPSPISSGAVVTALVAAAILVLLLGLVPGRYLEVATRSVMALAGR
jgi:NADH-quinone oxidoreductase subunit N